MKTSGHSHLFRLLTILLFISTILLFGCNQQSRGFALPKGDLEAGKLAFYQFNCSSCHTIADIEWTGNEQDIKVPLGGKVTQIKTYGELVTSVINPSHKAEKKYLDSAENVSKMKVYNEIMTIKELIDIVTFLQSEYEIEPPKDFYYPY